MGEIPDALLVASTVCVDENDLLRSEEFVGAPRQDAKPQIMMLAPEYVGPEKAWMPRVVNVGQYLGLNIAFASHPDSIAKTTEYSRSMRWVPSCRGVTLDFLVRVVREAYDGSIKLLLHHFLPG